MRIPKSEFRNLVFLKLGGSLITDKANSRTARPAALARLATEIAEALAIRPKTPLLLGHGSGSFAHVSAQKHNTRQGVHSQDQWRGFATVWQDAACLNRLVMDALLAAGLPAITLAPSACVIAQERQILSWNIAPLQAALSAGLLPVIYGDAVFDAQLGGTVLSTEDLFAYLANSLRPRRILLAGIEPGVWENPPLSPHSRTLVSSGALSGIEREWGEERGVIIPEITPANFDKVASSLGGSRATDVTGGMADKVRQMLAIAEQLPDLEILIFSGEQPGLVRDVLLGANAGTLVHS